MDSIITKELLVQLGIPTKHLQELITADLEYPFDCEGSVRDYYTEVIEYAEWGQRNPEEFARDHGNDLYY